MAAGASRRVDVHPMVEGARWWQRRSALRLLPDLAEEDRDGARRGTALHAMLVEAPSRLRREVIAGGRTHSEIEATTGNVKGGRPPGSAAVACT